MNAARVPTVDLHVAPGIDLTGLKELADPVFLARLVATVWAYAEGPLPAKVEVALMGEEEHCRVHARFLDDPTPTDVMAFPYEDPDNFGEVLVNVDMARRQAQERALDPLQEGMLYVVHGCLHLVGYDDHEEGARARMRQAEADVLARFA